jgi:hypothetical protein
LNLNPKICVLACQLLKPFFQTQAGHQQVGWSLQINACSQGSENFRTVRHRAATWFLFESQRAFFLACSEAGIDAERLREHLRKVESGEIIEIE